MTLPKQMMPETIREALSVRFAEKDNKPGQKLVRLEEPKAA
jgi:hypothetical protein